jgi:hypothetical protein
VGCVGCVGCVWCVWCVGGVGGVGSLLTFDIPQTALVATLDTYDLSFSGMKIASDALNKSSLGKFVPNPSDFMPSSKPASSTAPPTSNPGYPPPSSQQPVYPSQDYPDGNCASGMMFSGHQHQFQSGAGSVKKWSGQDYNELKRQCKSRGMLFEDPEFQASNRLLVDDSNQFVVSYFGRTQYDQNSIEWLRPHVSIFRSF